MITPEDLRTELDRLGVAVSLRTLTDWRAKGLLPPLEKKGLGQGRGTTHYWSDPEVIPQAALIHRFLGEYAVADAVLLELWTAGYSVSHERAKESWITHLKKRETRISEQAKKEKQGYLGLLTNWVKRPLKSKKYKAIPKDPILIDFFIEQIQLIHDPNFQIEIDLLSGTIVDYLKMKQSDENYEQVEKILSEIEPILAKILPIKSVIPFVETISIEEMQEAQKLLGIVHSIIVQFFKLSFDEMSELEARHFSCQLTREIGRFVAICFIQLQRQGIEFPIQESLNSIQDYGNHLSNKDVSFENNYQFIFSDNFKSEWQKTYSELEIIWSK